MSTHFILTLSCPDRIGIVHAVSGFLTERLASILDSQQFSDPDTQRFFMRVEFELDTGVTAEELSVAFHTVARSWKMEWELNNRDSLPRVLIMVSKQGHCLNDLLYRFRIGSMRGQIAGVVSNHPDWSELTESSDVPFHHIPVTADNKAQAEDQLLELVDSLNVDVVVLARYMQVISPKLCEKLSGRIINIHHSFLPSFKGARPYHQAHARGVKLIGATCHYVTSDLDEGPIIDQEVARVNHTATPADLTAAGRDLESTCLARGLAAHLEQRILRNDNKTVVFH